MRQEEEREVKYKGIIMWEFVYSAMINCKGG
jgi:hypothetical protein